jgi:hypothetical protein
MDFEMTEMSRSASHRSPLKELEYMHGGNRSREASLSRPMRQGPDQGSTRRHRHQPKMNLYTECGRHSDEWLFGGFSVSDAVRKIWERKE